MNWTATRPLSAMISGFEMNIREGGLELAVELLKPVSSLDGFGHQRIIPDEILGVNVIGKVVDLV